MSFLLASILGVIFLPLLLLHRGVIRFRNFLYDQGVLSTVKAAVPVISVGNLTMGGTNKTPVVDQLLTELSAAKKNIAVVGRSYKARNQGHLWIQNAVVLASSEEISEPVAATAQWVGDEILQLSKKHPKVFFVATQNKGKAVEFFAEKIKAHVDLLIIDDGFQHRRLYRDLDFVLIDTKAGLADLRWPPWGRLREPLAGLKRAQTILLTKTEKAAEKNQLSLQKKIHQLRPTANVVSLKSHLVLPTEVTEGARLAAVAGIAQPEHFFNALKKALRTDLLFAKSYPDHYPFSDKDLQEWDHWRNQQNIDWVLCTEKDFVKISDPPVWLKPVGLKLEAGIGWQEAVIEKINALLC